MEENKITTYYIQGNHDTDESYINLSMQSKKNKYVKDISGELVTYKGLNILGLSFFDTENKTKLREYISKKNKIDILLSHCQNGRRPFLFEFDTKYIITGHFDQQFFTVEKKVFMSFQGSESYSVIEINKKNTTIHLYSNKINSEFFGSNPTILKAKLKNENIIWESNNTIRNEQLKKTDSTLKPNLQSLYEKHFGVTKYYNTFSFSKGLECCIPLILKIKSEYKITSNVSNELKEKCIENRLNTYIYPSTQIDFLGKRCFRKLNEII
ncbi:MAG: hypothetical protein IPH32_09215 [Bacteroidetes bacterium]|nr:hypothetical protein [Bacteroidota bacterium]